MSFIASSFSRNLSLFSIHKLFLETSFISTRNYAARKGTRERKQKKKGKKQVEVKTGFVPHNLRKKEMLLAARPKLKFDDSWKSEPIDDVYHVKYYRMKTHSFQEAVSFHRETHHPDMYNEPKSNLHIRIELNMQGIKSTRFVEDFTRIVPVAHKFEHGEERSIIAFSKGGEALKRASDAGAQLVGGVDLIKQIQNGTVSLQNFQFIIAHPDILPELVALRGLMKRKFPNSKGGTLDVDLGAVVEKFMHGVSYSAKKDEVEKDFGLINTVIGKLDMENEHLEANFAALVKDVYSMRPKREGHFISRCLVWSPPSKEQFKVDHEKYCENKSSANEDDEAGERVAL